MKRLTQSLIAIACISAGAFSMNANALTWQQANVLPEALAQAEVVSTTGCSSFKTPGMNQAVKNLRIWKEEVNHPLVNSNYRAAKKEQKRQMSTIQWNAEKCAGWDSNFVILADTLAAQGYGSKVVAVKPSGQSNLTAGQKFGYLNIIADFCGNSGAYGAMDAVRKESGFDSSKISDYNNDAYKDMKKMGKGKFCQTYSYLAN